MVFLAICNQALRRSGFQISDVALAQLIRRLDADGDGSIEYHEFVRFSQSQAEVRFLCARGCHGAGLVLQHVLTMLC